MILLRPSIIIVFHVFQVFQDHNLLRPKKHLCSSSPSPAGRIRCRRWCSGGGGGRRGPGRSGQRPTAAGDRRRSPPRGG